MNTFNKTIIALAIASGASFSAKAESDWANLERYAAENHAIIENPDKQENLVVFLGNSITDYWPGVHPEFFADNNFVGRGISGQTTYQFLVRFRNDVVALHPAAVVINGGINDIAQNNYVYNEDITFGNLVSMAEIANANGIIVIMTSVLPSNRCGWRPDITDVAPKVASLNARIKEYAKKHGYAFIDYFTPMVYGEEGAINPAYSDDGVHPSPEGYTVMEQTALPIIKTTLKKKSKKK